MNNQTKTNKQDIVELFKTMAGSNKEITQLRYINELGQEIIRVDRDKLGDDIYLVEETKLQNKKHRYYFIDTMKKSDGEFDLSKLDLNIENNKITIPHKPVLRFAIPLYSDNKPKGILVVNTFAQKLLNRLLHSQQFDIDIYDKDKQVLVPSLNDNWSRYLNINTYLKTGEFIATQRLIKARNGESLFIGLTPKQNYNNYDLYFNKNMFILIVLMIIASIIAAVYLAKIPQKLLRKLAIRDKTIDKNIIFYRIDKSQIITEVSEAFCKYSAYTKKELIGKNHNFLIDSKAQQDKYENFCTTIKTKKIYYNQIQILLNDNQKCWVDTKIMPEYDENAQLIGYISIMQDITDQKENIRLLEENSKLLQIKQDELMMENELLLDSEQELLKALEDFEIFFNAMPTPYIVIADNLQMKFWNPIAENTFRLKVLLKIEIRPLTLIANDLSQIDFTNYLRNDTYKDRPYKVQMSLVDKNLKYFNVHVIKHPVDKESYILSFSEL